MNNNSHEKARTVQVELDRDELLVLVGFHQDRAMRALSPKFLTSSEPALPLDFGKLDDAQSHVAAAKFYSSLADNLYHDKIEAACNEALAGGSVSGEEVGA